ncbi:hypothetical protein [Halotalea alkalilenta]|uniref:hypothetical protein n=1 Tax=Halotalea alkalilenta TaxID=376489 RepID=UPI000485A003|nr:hypothetical protein [Halotalea alkalilenta]
MSEKPELPVRRYGIKEFIAAAVFMALWCFMLEGLVAWWLSFSFSFVRLLLVFVGCMAFSLFQGWRRNRRLDAEQQR